MDCGFTVSGVSGDVKAPLLVCDRNKLCDMWDHSPGQRQSIKHYNNRRKGKKMPQSLVLVLIHLLVKRLFSTYINYKHKSGSGPWSRKNSLNDVALAEIADTGCPQVHNLFITSMTLAFSWYKNLNHNPWRYSSQATCSALVTDEKFQ